MKKKLIGTFIFWLLATPAGAFTVEFISADQWGMPDEDIGLVGGTGGEARLFGKSVGAPAPRRRVGYLPEAHRLPPYLTGKGRPSAAGVREALRLTGYFLENWVRPAFELESLPPARDRLVRLMDKLELVEERADSGPSYDAGEEAWLAKFGLQTTSG